MAKVTRLTTLDEAASQLDVPRQAVLEYINRNISDFATRSKHLLKDDELKAMAEALKVLRIDVSRQTDGFTFRLHPRSRMRFTPPTGTVIGAGIFVSFETLHDFNTMHGSAMLLNQVPIMLTGLSREQLKQQGISAIVYFDAAAQTELWKADVNG